MTRHSQNIFFARTKAAIANWLNTMMRSLCAWSTISSYQDISLPCRCAPVRKQWTREQDNHYRWITKVKWLLDTSGDHSSHFIFKWHLLLKMTSRFVFHKNGMNNLALLTPFSAEMDNGHCLSKLLDALTYPSRSILFVLWESVIVQRQWTLYSMRTADIIHRVHTTNNLQQRITNFQDKREKSLLFSLSSL